LKQVGLWELVRYFLRLGAFGFGGPIALAGQGSISDIPTAAIGIVSLLLIWRWTLPEPVLIAGAAVVGFFLYKG
jgi:chromate transport protein ChrA